MAEDDEITAEMYTLGLERRGWSVAWARDGAEAIRIATLERPAAILLDIHLPRINGLSVLKALQVDAKSASTPVLVLTNLSVADAEALEARRLGARAILEKTATPPALLDQILRLNLSASLEI